MNQIQRIASYFTQATLVAAVLLAVPVSAQTLRRGNYPFGLKQAATETDAYLIGEYNDWKTHYVTTSGTGATDRLRVQRDSVSAYDTVSEGQSYGMLLAVYFNDRTTFDSLYRYAQAHFGGPGNLMQWMIRADGTNISEFRLPFTATAEHAPAMLYKADVLVQEEQKRYLESTDPLVIANPADFLQASQYGRGFSSATDADMDIAASLCFAHSKWGSTGTINYIQEAAKNIKNIIDADSANAAVGGVSHRYLKAGNKWGDRGTWNPSYFMPAWLRMYAKFISDNKAAVAAVFTAGTNTPDTYIGYIADLQATMYSEMQLINAANGTAGLYPDWCGTATGTPIEATGSDRYYYLDKDRNGSLDTDASGNYIAYQHEDQSFNFFYDAVRVPWRVGLDYSLNGDADALAINTEVGNFFRGKALTMVDGYSITGGAWDWAHADGFNTGEGGLWHNSGAFVAMSATASMALTDTANAAAYYAEVKKQKSAYNDPTNPNHYYGNTLRLLALLYMSGRMPDLTTPEIPSLAVQFMTYNASATTNTLFVNIRVRNTGDSDVDVSKLATSYWFGAENPAVSDVAEKDTAFVMNSGNQVAAAVAVATTTRGAQNRVQNTTFPGATRVLKAGEFVELHLRIHKSNWTNYNQSNDYSFTAANNWADTRKVTVYYNGFLAAGAEP